MCKCLEFSAILTQLSHKTQLSDWVDGPLLLPVLFYEIVSWYEPWPKQTLQGIFHVRLYFEKHELNDSDLALCPSPCSSTHFRGKELLFFPLFFFFFFLRTLLQVLFSVGILFCCCIFVAVDCVQRLCHVLTGGRRKSFCGVIWSEDLS